jgi:hypothetical protein
MHQQAPVPREQAPPQKTRQTAAEGKLHAEHVMPYTAGVLSPREGWRVGATGLLILGIDNQIAAVEFVCVAFEWDAAKESANVHKHGVDFS